MISLDIGRGKSPKVVDERPYGSMKVPPTVNILGGWQVSGATAEGCWSERWEILYKFRQDTPHMQNNVHDAS